MIYKKTYEVKEMVTEIIKPSDIYKFVNLPSMRKETPRVIPKSMEYDFTRFSIEYSLRKEGGYRITDFRLVKYGEIYLNQFFEITKMEFPDLDYPRFILEKVEQDSNDFWE